MIDDLWYKNAIIYSLDLESFMDGNGDGIGDFQGLMRRLEYLESLGVDTIWLAPFQISPNRDNGYDVSDYYGVDPRHGSPGDFVEFMRQAKGRGIRVIIDLVINHTSDRHSWFQEARQGPDSPRHDWYVWSKKRPPDWNQGMVFPGVQDRTWTYDRKAKAYYFHRFYSFQPDLNVDHPEVRRELRKVIGYWLELGVAGFRVDAVPFLIETKTPGKESGELHMEYLSEFRSFMQWRVGDAILLGEANVLPEDTRQYFEGDGTGGIHMMFNFWVNQHLFYALASGDTLPLREALTATRDIPEMAQWGQFLRNHDELDLGRLTEEQRQRVFAQFGPDDDMQLYERGIRRRLASMLGDRSHLELAYSLLFSLPGTPVMRYGDEIGMGDDLTLQERDAVRTPMQWSAERNGGFSTAEQTYLPVVTGGMCGYARVNVEAQRRDPSSLLNWTGRMIRLRKECPEIGWGSYEVLPLGDDQILALRYDWDGGSLLIVHNFSRLPTEVRVELGRKGVDRLADLLREVELTAAEDGVFHIPMEAFGYRWFRAGGMGYGSERVSD